AGQHGRPVGIQKLSGSSSLRKASGDHGKLVLRCSTLGWLGAARVFRHPEVVEEQPWVPVELADFLGDVADASGLDQADGETAQTGDVFRAVAGADAA